jgi:hypothetical protein
MSQSDAPELVQHHSNTQPGHGPTRDLIGAVAGLTKEDTTAERWSRVSALAWSGVTSVPEAAEEAFSKDHIASTLEKAAVSTALTFGMACLYRSPGALATIPRIAAPALSVAFAADVLGNGKSIVNAFESTWRSGDHHDQNVKTMKDSFGRFVVDLGINSIGGGLGEMGGREAFFSRWTNGVNELPSLNRANVLAKLESGKTQGFRVDFGGEVRRVDIHAPANPDGNPNLTVEALLHGGANRKGIKTGVFLDSLLLNKPTPGMDLHNGVSASADAAGVLAIYPHATTYRLLPGVNISHFTDRGAGILQEGSWLVAPHKTDDAAFVSSTIVKLREVFNIDRLAVGGFSTGSMPHEVAGRLGEAGVRNFGVFTVNDTHLPTSALPPVGTDLLAISGLKNSSFPPGGGPGKATRVLDYLGQGKRISESQPLLQPIPYLDANGFSGKPVRTGAALSYTELVSGKAYADSTAPTHMVWENGNGRVERVILPKGTNAWPGRLNAPGYNPGYESLLSGANGINGAPDSFPANDAIFSWLLRGRPTTGLSA